MQSAKRRHEVMFTPLDLNSSDTVKRSIKSHKLITKKKLQFVLNDSPIMHEKKVSTPTKSKVLFNYDETSCEIGFTEAGNSISFDDIENLNNDVFGSDNLLDSPLARLNNLEIRSSIQTNRSNSQLKNRLNISAKSVRFIKKNKTEFLNESAIKKALDNMHHEHAIDKNRLIGDMTKTHSLPIMACSKHNDLPSITSDTLADLIGGKYNDQIGEYLILDARYPYEFKGGHIETAESAYVKEELFEKLFNKPLTSTNGKPVVLIFHCEFSSERGPKLMREIRERDRMINKLNYPCLNYPEMYLLEGGYKSFFESFDDLCVPKSYLPMLHDNHRNDLKYFRSKSKSWDVEIKKRITKSKLSFD